MKYLAFLLGVLLASSAWAQQVPHPVQGPPATAVGMLPIWDATTGNALAASEIGGYKTAAEWGASWHPPNVIAGTSPGFVTANGIAFRKQIATATDGQNVLIERDAAFAGGAVGQVNTALNTQCNVAAGVLSHEFCSLAYLSTGHTKADGSNMVAHYSQAIRRSSGATWASTIEVIDRNPDGVAASGPAVGLEIDVRANGPNPGGDRVILQLIGTKDNLGGVVPFIDAALKIGIEPAFGIGGAFGQAIQVIGGPYEVGIDFRGVTAFGSAAVWMKENTPIVWDAAANVKQFYYSDIGAIVFSNAANNPNLQFFPATGQMVLTNGTVSMLLDPLNAGAIVGTMTAHDLVLFANNSEQARILAAGGLQVTNGVLAVSNGVFGSIKTTLGPIVPSNIGAVGTTTAQDFIIMANSAEQIRAVAGGGVKFANLPGVEGGGGLTLCVDTAGTVYKKAACP